jgi:hypothetical protein
MTSGDACRVEAADFDMVNVIELLPYRYGAIFRKRSRLA